MFTLSLVAAAAMLAVTVPSGVAPALRADLHAAAFRNSDCFVIDRPIYEAAVLCLQVDDENEQAPRWALQNTTDWVLDLDSPGAWNEQIEVETFPTPHDLTSFFTRAWINDRDGFALAVQPDEIVFMPAYLNVFETDYLIPSGELRFNAEATAAMVALTSAIAAADEVATQRSKLYKIVKRAKACATAGAAALLATDQSRDAYAVVLAELTAYSACDRYLRGVAKQAKTPVPRSWQNIPLEFGDNFFIQARTAVIRLFQFVPRV